MLCETLSYSPKSHVRSLERSTDERLIAPRRFTTITTTDTLLAWYCKLVPHQFDGSAQRKRAVGRLRVDQEMKT